MITYWIVKCNTGSYTYITLRSMCVDMITYVCVDIPMIIQYMHCYACCWHMRASITHIYTVIFFVDSYVRDPNSYTILRMLWVDVFMLRTYICIFTYFVCRYVNVMNPYIMLRILCIDLFTIITNTYCNLLWWLIWLLILLIGVFILLTHV